MIGFQTATSIAKDRYYHSHDQNGVTVAESRHWDEFALGKLIQQGMLVPATWRRCLLAGCASARSLVAMEALLIWLHPEITDTHPLTLFVLDREQQAINRLRDIPTVPGIRRQLVQTDVLDFQEVSGCQLIRSDYLHNFIDPRKQATLMQSLSHMLAPDGIIASTLMMVSERLEHLDACHWQRGTKTHFQSRRWEDEDTEIRGIDVSRFCLEQAARAASLTFWDAAWSEEEEEDDTREEAGCACYEQHYIIFRREARAERNERKKGQKW